MRRDCAMLRLGEFDDFLNLLNSVDGQMAEIRNPPRLAGRHFSVNIKIVHFGRKGTPHTTAEEVAAALAAAICMPVHAYGGVVSRRTRAPLTEPSYPS